jgi:iron complex transport system substrate-binding protein
MVDIMNRAPDPGSAPQRVISLVPWMTDTMTAFGLDRFLAGVSDACPVSSPPGGPIPRMGKPREPRVKDIVDLLPDLVLASPDENPQSAIDELAAAGVPVWAVRPRTVRESVSIMRDLVLLYASERALQTVVWLDRAVDWLDGSRPEKSVRVFCPRSRDGEPDCPKRWVTVGADTYTGDLLSLCGGEDVFSAMDSGRERAITPEDVAAAAPEVILLPGGAFSFSTKDAEAMQALLPDVPAVRNGKILFVDGQSIFWPGWRLGEAIRKLPDMLRSR